MLNKDKKGVKNYAAMADKLLTASHGIPLWAHDWFESQILALWEDNPPLHNERYRIGAFDDEVSRIAAWMSAWTPEQRKRLSVLTWQLASSESHIDKCRKDTAHIRFLRGAA